MGWGSFFDKLISKLPIQNRKERWKNQIDDLKVERDAILREDYDEKKARRLIGINNRIAKLERLLRNVA